MKTCPLTGLETELVLSNLNKLIFSVSQRLCSCVLSSPVLCGLTFDEPDRTGGHRLCFEPYMVLELFTNTSKQFPTVTCRKVTTVNTEVKKGRCGTKTLHRSKTP